MRSLKFPQNRVGPASVFHRCTFGPLQVWIGPKMYLTLSERSLSNSQMLLVPRQMDSAIHLPYNDVGYYYS